MTITWTWICPTQCGCVLERTAEWSLTEERRQRMDAHPLGVYYHRQCQEEGLWDRGTESQVILEQCQAHAHVHDADALWAEIGHFTENTHRLVACGCKLAYWWDKRLDSVDRVHHHLNNPLRTTWCPVHAHLCDPDAHFTTAMLDQLHYVYVTRHLQQMLGLEAGSVPWMLAMDRTLILMPAKVGIPAALIRMALETASPSLIGLVRVVDAAADLPEFAPLVARPERVLADV